MWRCSTLTAVVILVPLAQPALAAKPDLVVPFAQLTSKPWAFQEPHQTVSFADRTKNAGTATAGRSRTRLELLRELGGTTGYAGPSRDVAQLKPGDSSKGAAAFTRSFARTPLGGYFAQACADVGRVVHEAQEDNNCRYTGEHLTVIPRKWTGTVKGSGTFGSDLGVRETWSGQVTFKFDPGLSGPGNLWYEPTGTIHYKMSGTDTSGCTYTGSGTTSGQQDGGLEIYGYFARYQGSGSVPNSSPGYQIEITGEDCSGSIRGPLHQWLLAPARPITPRFGITALDDQYYNGTTNARWVWNLAASP